MSTRAFARMCAVNVSYLALTAVPAHFLVAQASPLRRSAPVDRTADSVIASILADTLTADAPNLSAHWSRQSVTIRPVSRSYRVGKINAAEEGVYTSFVKRYARATLRLDVTPLSFRGDTSTTAGRPQVRFGGLSPLSGRVDLRLRAADTLRFFAQSGSSPGALSAEDAQALGAVGTSTIDLDAATLGIAPRVGARYSLTQRIGVNGLAMSVRGGIEYDPKPSGSDAVSWRGTTLRGGLGLSRTSMSGNVGAMVEVTQSYADSLRGRNLFPGGGSLNVEARLMRLIGASGTGLFALNTFYSRPLSIQRQTVKTRLLPIGDFMGVTAAGGVPVGRFSILPTLTILRESSQTRSTSSGTTTVRDASGTTAVAALGFVLPLGRHLTVTPEGGLAFGSVGQTSTAASIFGGQRQSFRDSVRGRYLTLEISLRD